MSIPGDSFTAFCYWVQEQPVAMVVFCHFVLTVRRVHRHGDGYDYTRLNDCCDYSREFIQGVRAVSVVGSLLRFHVLSGLHF